MSKMKWDCPIVICTFNRPEYFKRCIDSVIETPEVQSKEVPVYVFCDGGKHSTQKEIDKILNDSPIPVKKFFQSTNLCIPKHMHYIRSTMFDVENRSRFMFLEEDIIVSKYYYRFMNRVLDIYEKHDPTVVMVNSCSVCLDDLNTKLVKQRYFSDALSHLNNFILSIKSWDSIKPLMEEYIELFIKPIEHYRLISHDKVMKWALEKASNSTNLYFKNGRKMNHLTSSQDSITNLSMRLNNFRYVCSYVNRILNIGEKGYHYIPEFFKQHKLDEMSLDLMPGDKDELMSIWDSDIFSELKI